MLLEHKMNFLPSVSSFDNVQLAREKPLNEVLTATFCCILVHIPVNFVRAGHHQLLFSPEVRSGVMNSAPAALLLYTELTFYSLIELIDIVSFM